VVAEVDLADGSCYRAIQVLYGIEPTVWAKDRAIHVAESISPQQLPRSVKPKFPT